jgi:hypothetical protein
MNSTATFFIETACVAGIAPLGMDVSARPPRAPRAARRHPVRLEPDAEERYVEELLATFGDRWEW